MGSNENALRGKVFNQEHRLKQIDVALREINNEIKKNEESARENLTDALIAKNAHLNSLKRKLISERSEIPK